MNCGRVILFEGPDNVGKGTQIRRTLQWFADKQETAHIVHYSSAVFSNIKECIDWSEKTYREMFLMASFLPLRRMNLIMDRAHFGEWVYGKLYRGYDANFIWELENNFQSRLKEAFENITLILLVNNPEILIQRDDGLSHSLEIEKRIEEINRFKDAFERTIIKDKHLIDCQDLTIEETWLKVRNSIEQK